MAFGMTVTEEHHRTRTFQEEYVEFLKRGGVEYDDRYLW
jgi:hypothetical protein